MILMALGVRKKLPEIRTGGTFILYRPEGRKRHMHFSMNSGRKVLPLTGHFRHGRGKSQVIRKSTGHKQIIIVENDVAFRQEEV